MDDGYCFGFRMDKVFITTFIFSTTKVFSSEVLNLEIGTHCAIEDDHRTFGTMEPREKRTGHIIAKIGVDLSDRDIDKIP